MIATAHDGIWTMTEEGEFILAEPYATWLQEAKLAATAGWAGNLVGYLAERTSYTPEELRDALLERNARGLDPHETVDSFVLEALSGDL